MTEEEAKIRLEQSPLKKFQEQNRPCTCHPDDKVTPCPQKFAAHECQEYAKTI